MGKEITKQKGRKDKVSSAQSAKPSSENLVPSSSHVGGAELAMWMSWADGDGSRSPSN